ncbi:MAG TPA: tyrosine-type recombinase/integrase, partial [Ktedonobacteraceae bacterium]|nr:tyrosine-type recombinase/integrase [Ktedonobacteraceae bacterium]
HQLRIEEDLAYATIRNYLSDLRHFAAWCEFTWKQGRESEPSFIPEAVTTPALTDYRMYLQEKLRLKANSVNRSLVSLKRYFAWLLNTSQIRHDPAKVVKLVGEENVPPRHLNDQEEQALVAAVTEKGDTRDRAIIILMLHTGLRAREVCTITHSQVRLGKRSGTLTVRGKRNKYREIPLNATARAALAAYDSSLLKPSHDPTPLFLSEKRHTQLTERGLGYLVKKYADRAHVSDVSPHDLRHRFGYRMAQSIPLHRLAQLMGHDSLDTTLIYVQGTKEDLQQAVETIAWV